MLDLIPTEVLGLILDNFCGHHVKYRPGSPFQLPLHFRCLDPGPAVFWTLGQLALTSKYMNELVTPRLYHSLFEPSRRVPGSKWMVLLARTLIARPDIAERFVRHIATRPDCDEAIISREEEASISREDGTPAAVRERCQTLNSAYWPNPSYQQPCMRFTTLRALICSLCPNLMSIACDFRRPRLYSDATALTGLRAVRILLDCPYHGEPAEVLPMLLMMAPNLRVLQIWSNWDMTYEYRPGVGRNRVRVTFNNVTELDVHRIWMEEEGLAGILAICPGVRKLTVSSWTLLADDADHPPKSKDIGWVLRLAPRLEVLEVVIGMDWWWRQRRSFARHKITEEVALELARPLQERRINCVVTKASRYWAC
jgi:hypothetical protein